MKECQRFVVVRCCSGERTENVKYNIRLLIRSYTHTHTDNRIQYARVRTSNPRIPLFHLDLLLLFFILFCFCFFFFVANDFKNDPENTNGECIIFVRTARWRFRFSPVVPPSRGYRVLNSNSSTGPSRVTVVAWSNGNTHLRLQQQRRQEQVEKVTKILHKVRYTWGRKKQNKNIFDNAVVERVENDTRRYNTFGYNNE